MSFYGVHLACAFAKTLAESTGIRCLMEHGRHPLYGLKPMGLIARLEEDGEIGAAYEVKLHDTALNLELLPALGDGLFGSSFRFRVLMEEVTPNPPRSAWNPDRIEERVIREAQVREFGPVVFPAYADATARLRTAAPWSIPRHTPAERDRRPGWYLAPRRDPHRTAA